MDVRPPEERAIASVPLPFMILDAGRAEVEALPKDAAIAFLCHGGGRSGRAAVEFRLMGFRNVHNVAGGIVAWAETVDPSIPKY